MHLHKNEVDGPYSLTVAVGVSVWGVVGVLFPWGGRLVLPFIIIIIIIIIIIDIGVCVLTTADLITDLCNCYSD